MMRDLIIGTMLLGAVATCGAQSNEELQRKITEQAATIERLQQRIQLLERELTPSQIGNDVTIESAPQDAAADSNRALERALVREGAVLLSPGVAEVEPNFVASHSSGDGGFRRTSFGPGLTVRVGLPKKWQVEASLPYVFETIKNGGQSTNANGIGDLSVVASHQFMAESDKLPSVVGSLSYQSATGRNTSYEHRPLVGLGSGFPSLQASANTIKRIDPLVFFGSVSATWFRARDKGGADIRPGNIYGLRFGVALATAPATSLRAAINLNHLNKTHIDGAPVPTDDVNAFLELGGSAVLTPATAIDVIFAAGLTRNTPDFRLMVSIPTRF
jgi:type II secretory pathway pseudopilin PulG